MVGQKLKSQASGDVIKPRMPARLNLIEDILVGLLLASTLLLYSLALNSHFTLPKLAVFSFLVGALLLVFLFRLKIGEYQVLPLPIRLPLLLLVIWWLLGTSQAIHMQTAVDGQYGRYNGLLTNLSLVTMFIVLASSRFDLDRFRRFLSVMLVLVMIVCIYAFIQYVGFDQLINLKPGSRPVSSVGNPVALATILLLAMPLVFADFLIRSKANQKVTLGVSFLLILWTFFITGSRGPLLGLTAGVVTILAVYLYLHPRQLRRLKPAFIVTGFVLIMLVTGLGIYLLKDRLSLGVAVEMRLTYFDVARQMILDSPVFGYGFESFRLAYPIYRPLDDATFGVSQTVVTPTMIHNDYLQLAADNGLPAMLFYLLFIGGLVWLLFRALKADQEFRVYHAGILAMLLAYLAQGMSGWLEAASSIIYWLFLGVSTSFVLQRLQQQPVAERLSSYIYMVVISAGLIVSGVYAYRFTNKVVQDYTLRQAQYYSQARLTITDEKLSWLARSAEHDAYYQDRVGMVYLDRMARIPSRKTYRLAYHHFLQARKLNEYDPYIRFHLIKADALAIRARLIKKPTSIVLEDMNEIVRMDPNNPTVYQVRAELFSVLGKAKQARENLNIMKKIQGYRK